MKALTIQNPYAWAITVGAKDVENRTRTTAHRGEFAIHAGAAWFRGADRDPRIVRAWWGGWGGGPERVDAADLGPGWWRAVLAVADLYGCHVPSPGCCTSVWAEPTAGAHWLLRDVRRLDVPVPARGALGLWTLPDDVATAVRRSTEAA